MFVMPRPKKIASSLLVALFVSYYADITFFSHAHIINGATIVHSHIHANSHHDTYSGGHTEHCITLIAQMSQFQYIDFTCNHLPVPLQLQIHQNKQIEVTPWIASIYFQNISLRAPPIV